MPTPSPITKRAPPNTYSFGANAQAIAATTKAREFNLTPTGTGMIASSITFGAIIGALIGGYLTSGSD
jgi:MFS-type transporter involved in bile tolerance (Atg22 family)